MKKLVLLWLSICFGFIPFAQGQTNYLNGPEGISYHQASKCYFVSNATDGKIIKIDSLLNQSVFYEGFSVPMGVEIIGDILFIASNNPSTVSGIDVITGDLIGSMIISESPSMAHMDFDPGTGLLYVIGQTGQVFKIHPNTMTYNVFVSSGLPNGTQTCSIDILLNCMYIFSWPATTVRSVSLSDSTDIQTLVYPALGQQIDCTKDSEGNIYVSSWQGNKIVKYLPGCLTAPEVFSSGYNKPAGLAYNQDKNLIAIANYGGNAIDFIELSPTGLNNYDYNSIDLKIYPNPFQSRCNIEYHVSKDHEVRLDLFDASGRHIKNISRNTNNEGKHTLSFDGQELVEGMYYCRLTVGDVGVVRKIICTHK